MIYPELGFYVLPGHVSDPKEASEQIVVGDELGLGSVWISERLSTKNVEVLSGLAAAKTARMGIASGLMANMPLRHPLVTAGYASTMMKLTDNRFALGVGRSSDLIAKRAGIPKSTFQVMQDYIAILRQLWRGEAVTYNGPLGTYSGLVLDAKQDVMPPVIMAVMGEKTAYWAGQHCDGVVYNSLLSAAAAARLTRCVRRGAADAGRDPGSVKVWAILITASDVSEEIVLSTVIRRLNTYVLLPTTLPLVCAANGWDFSRVETIRNELQKIDGPAEKGLFSDEHTSSDLSHLRRIRELYPQQWIDEGHAVGTARECVDKVLERFDAGVDGVLFHGSHPANLKSLLKLWPEHRPNKIFDGRSVNPGL